MFWRNKDKVKHEFSVMDIVKVLPREKISASLDSNNNLDGCLFMDQMWQYCGKEFKVIKIIKNFYDDRERRMRRCRAPIYLLEGLMCDGNVEIFGNKCDRNCCILWHEKWLEKVGNSWE